MSQKPEHIGTCKDCDYRSPEGECRRFPPQIAPHPLDNQHPITYWPTPYWPTVYGDGWCGEYK